MPVRTEAARILRSGPRGGVTQDVSAVLDYARVHLVGSLSGGVTEYEARIAPAVPVTMREVAGFTDPEDVDVLRRVQWAAVDEAADEW